MALNHLGKFLVRFQALPLQAGFPILEEAPRPRFALVIAQLAIRLFQQVRRVQPFRDCLKLARLAINLQASRSQA